MGLYSVSPGPRQTYSIEIGLALAFHVVIDLNNLVFSFIFTYETLDEITQAIAELPKREFWQLTDSLVDHRNARWDDEFEEDCKAGRLDSLWAEAEKEIEDGKTESLDEFLDNEGL